MTVPILKFHLIQLRQRPKAIAKAESCQSTVSLHYCARLIVIPTWPVSGPSYALPRVHGCKACRFVQHFFLTTELKIMDQTFTKTLHVFQLYELGFRKTCVSVVFRHPLWPESSRWARCHVRADWSNSGNPLLLTKQTWNSPLRHILQVAPKVVHAP